MNDLERLGRPGAYRLGMLRARGAEPVPPKPYRPSFARRSRRGPASARVLGCLAGAAAIAGGAVVGRFFAAFILGMLAVIVAVWGVWLRRVLAARRADGIEVQVPDTGPLERGGETGDRVLLLSQNAYPVGGSPSRPPRRAGSMIVVDGAQHL
jgi:hypothetical protein